MNPRNFIALSVFAFVMCTLASGGTILPLSAYSSDETPPEDLSATLDFSVFDSTLTLVVSNLTDGPDDGYDDGFDINEVYFNATPNVTGLTLDSADPGWYLTTENMADGFGIFDFALLTNLPDQIYIQGESSATFMFSIAGTGPFYDTDFTTEFSHDGFAYIPTLAAAKFVHGPDDDSAYGGVPEPGTLGLLLIGVLAGVRVRRG